MSDSKTQIIERDDDGNIVSCEDFDESNQEPVEETEQTVDAYLPEDEGFKDGEVISPETGGERVGPAETYIDAEINPDDGVLYRTITLEIPIPEKRLLEIGQESGQLQLEIADLYATKKTYNDEMKERICDLQGITSVNLTMLRTKTETKQCKCKKVFNDAEKQKEYYYEGELVLSEDYSDEDNQRSLGIR